MLPPPRCGLHRSAGMPAVPAAAPRPDTGCRPDDDGAAGLLVFNGYGGFTPAGDEYVVRLPWQGGALRRPPLPWINVVSNERCGFIVSESGAGYTWARNSQANRLTPWFNDPVTDPHGEACYLRDEASGAVLVAAARSPAGAVRLRSAPRFRLQPLQLSA